ncbi:MULTISPECIES: DMT family transporter [Vagococcus]|uniref:Integral membrane protein n=1 Tax=Vagococcus fluvialis bH819 TaxID=1255619 RepID=A0A1X6WKC2_9ENTE|nr:MULTISPECIES: DMT family transporter [Vagococcus]SLM84680.1 Integral membrane protein [Vagococcus fluvialis bH819]HCM89856.1 EamA-like transporter family protein [Vagococcus sp.]
MNIFIFLILGLIAGACFPVQATINSRLGSYTKNPLTASLIAFSVGSIVLFLLVILFNFKSFFNIDTSVSPLVFLGGPIAGVIYNVANIILFSKIGAMITTMVTITGQMVTGMLIDHFGLLGMPVSAITGSRLLGIGMMLIAIFLFQKSKNQSNLEEVISKKWLFLGVLAGAFPPLQAAFNGQLRVATHSVLLSTFLSFFIGAIILVLLLLIIEKKITIPKIDSEGNNLPWWFYIGGLFGIIIVGGNILVIHTLGSILTTIIFILGQLVMATLIDHLGIFGLKKRSVMPMQYMSILMIVIALFLV